MAGGLNLYGYAGGDPVNFSDPFGLKITFIGTANQSAMRTLMRSSPTFASMVKALQAADGTMEVRAPRTVFERRALEATSFGQGAVVKIAGSEYAALLDESAASVPQSHLTTMAHEVAHLAGIFSKATGVPAACATEGNCVDEWTRTILKELQAAQASEQSSADRTPSTSSERKP